MSAPSASLVYLVRSLLSLVTSNRCDLFLLIGLRFCNLRVHLNHMSWPSALYFLYFLSDIIFSCLITSHLIAFLALFFFENSPLHASLYIARFIVIILGRLVNRLDFLSVFFLEFVNSLNFFYVNLVNLLTLL